MWRQQFTSSSSKTNLNGRGKELVCDFTSDQTLPQSVPPFRFVKKEQHNGVVTISQVPRLLRIMTVNVIHIAIEVLGDAGSLVFLPLGALRRECAFVFHDGHVEGAACGETTA